MSRGLSAYRQLFKRSQHTGGEIQSKFYSVDIIIVSKCANIPTFAQELKELRRALYSAIVVEQKKKIELSANRVGLNLPKAYAPANPQPLTNNNSKKKDRRKRHF